jgi:Integrase core domain
MSAGMTAQLVTDALVMAIWRRGKPDALLHHSDRGSQYSSEQFQRLILEHGIVCSMSRSGNVWDNAAMESFFSSLKTERTARKVYRTRDEAKADVLDYIERFYNLKRRHSKIGYPQPYGGRDARGSNPSTKPGAGHPLEAADAGWPARSSSASAPLPDAEDQQDADVGADVVAAGLTAPEAERIGLISGNIWKKWHGVRTRCAPRLGDTASMSSHPLRFRASGLPPQFLLTSALFGGPAGDGIFVSNVTMAKYSACLIRSPSARQRWPPPEPRLFASFRIALCALSGHAASKLSRALR